MTSHSEKPTSSCHIEDLQPQPSRDMNLQLPNSSQSETGCIKKHLYCGLGPFHPLWLQRFATPKCFLAALGMFVLVQSMMVSGITSSVITTIEKRYGFRSAEAGLVVSSFDIGSLTVVIFISYFGAHGHRARWVGVGAIFVAIGAVLFAFPQFLASPYQPTKSVNDDTDEFFCVSNRTNTTDLLCQAQTANSLYLLLFILSNMVMGIGSTPIYTLGSTFIYDNVPRDDASVYVSILYAVGAVGPAAGYLLGGFFLTLYIDLGNSLSQKDPRFLGAWWMGFLVCAGLILFTSIFLLMFPTRLKMPRGKTETPSGNSPMTPMSVTSITQTEVTVEDMDTSVISFGANLKELPKSLLSLIYNPIYMCVTLAATLEFSIVTAFLTFVPKYLQSNFDSDTVTSSIMTGGILVPSAGTGILLGGYIVKRLRLNITGCAKTAFLSNLLSVVLFVSVFFISCDMAAIVGVNKFPQDPISENFSTSLSSTCNSDCSCKDTQYNPVCFEGTSYYNPCFAGCRNSFYGNNSETLYTNCTCLPTTVSDPSLFVTHGECGRDCNSALAPFLCCLFLVTMATVCAHTPSLMVTYRCVKSEEKPFAAGVQFLFYRALAYIPAPIYFGMAIDHACLIWGGTTDQCSDGTGSCSLYEADRFRYIFFGVAFSLKVLAAVFMFLTWLLCRREYSHHNHTTRWRRIRRKKELRKLYSLKNNSMEKSNATATARLPGVPSRAETSLSRSSFPVVTKRSSIKTDIPNTSTSNNTATQWMPLSNQDAPPVGTVSTHVPETCVTYVFS